MIVHRGLLHGFVPDFNRIDLACEEIREKVKQVLNREWWSVNENQGREALVQKFRCCDRAVTTVTESDR